MKIASLHLKQFKRFTDLTISGIPETARLVVLVGPNGVGKSSLFEAFNVPLSLSKSSDFLESDYYVKQGFGNSEMQMWAYIDAGYIAVNFHDYSQIGSDWRNRPRTEEDKKAFYIRSCYRHESDFLVSSFAKQGSILDDPKRPTALISVDSRVSDNYARIVSDTIDQVFSDRDQTTREVRERIIGKVRECVRQVLPDLVLHGPGRAFEGGTFFFSKGQSHDWKYRNLSGGEKAAFDLLLDFAIKTEHFDNTVFCIDEPEVHTHTSVHGKLLGQLVQLLPSPCQLWVSTHSAGMMRAAREMEEAQPGSVVFLDFGGHDFDQPVTITPSVPDRTFWKRNLQVAIGDLAELVAPSHIVFCEGSREGKNREFDARCYNQIFAGEFPETSFVSVGGCHEVESNSVLLSSVFSQVLAGVQISSVIDRDDRSQNEREELEQKGVRVLSRRSIESYLYEDEVLGKLCAQHGQAEKCTQVLALKADALSESIKRGNASDDLKSIGDNLRQGAKSILRITQPGNTKEQFALNLLAPLVTLGTCVYEELKRDIFAARSGNDVPATGTST